MLLTPSVPLYYITYWISRNLAGMTLDSGGCPGETRQPIGSDESRTTNDMANLADSPELADMADAR